VTRTETNVVLSTQTERTRIALDLEEPELKHRPRRALRERARRPSRASD
jgi:hypothetical protein